MFRKQPVNYCGVHISIHQVTNKIWETYLPEQVIEELSITIRVFKFNIYGSMHRKYIPIYIKQDATLHSLFIPGNCSTCFGWYCHPSSGAHTTVSTASPLLLPAATAAVTMWQIPDAVDTVVCAPDDGWGYHPKHVEQFPDINKLCKVASCWMYIGIYRTYSHLVSKIQNDHRRNKCIQNMWKVECKENIGRVHNRRRMLDNKKKQGHNARRRVKFIEIHLAKMVQSCWKCKTKEYQYKLQ